MSAKQFRKSLGLSQASRGLSTLGLSPSETGSSLGDMEAAKDGQRGFCSASDYASSQQDGKKEATEKQHPSAQHLTQLSSVRLGEGA